MSQGGGADACDLGWLLSLVRFASPTLPVGAYAYSRGLEHAVQAGWVHDEASTRDWVLGLLGHTGVWLDGPVFARLHAAFAAARAASASAEERLTPERGLGVLQWNQLLIASRESAELRLEDTQLGAALMRLLAALGVEPAEAWVGRPDVSYATAFALAMAHHRVPVRPALCAFLWAQTEAQVSAAVRLVPLGQTAGQRILSEVSAALPGQVASALEVADEAVGAFAPALALGSALHETQYTRLFRS